METIVATHTTALQLIRFARANGLALNVMHQPANTGHTPQSNAIRTAIKIMQEVAQFHQYPFYHAVTNRGLLSYSDELVKPVLMKYSKIPLVTIDDFYGSPILLREQTQIVLPSPAYVAALLSKHDTLLELCQHAVELCGYYTFDAHGNTILENSMPSCCVSEIYKASKLLPAHTINSKKLKRALQFITDNSASPAETNLFLILTLPTCLGGLGIKNLVMNKEIKLNNKASKIAGQKVVKPDIVYYKNRVAIEYDSKTFHTDDTQNQKDKQRSEALKYSGWKVYSIVASQLMNWERIFLLGLDIRKSCGYSTRIRVSEYKEKSMKLHYLLTKNEL